MLMRAKIPRMTPVQSVASSEVVDTGAWKLEVVSLGRDSSRGFEVGVSAVER